MILSERWIFDGYQAKRFQELRVAKGLSQEELAGPQWTLSERDFFPRLERDLTSPSIATLMDILQCLGTTVSEFFQEEPEDQIVFQNEDYFEKIDSELGSKTEWIIPNAQKNMMEPIPS